MHLEVYLFPVCPLNQRQQAAAAVRGRNKMLTLLSVTKGLIGNISELPHMNSAWTVWQLFATGRNEMRKSSFRCLIGKKSFDLKMVLKKIASIIFLSGLVLHCHVQYSQSYYSQTQNHVLHFSPAPLCTPMWTIRILEVIAMLRFLKYPLPFDFFQHLAFRSNDGYFHFCGDAFKTKYFKCIWNMENVSLWGGKGHCCFCLQLCLQR